MTPLSPIHESWCALVAEQVRQPYWSELRVKVLGDRACGPVYPPQGQTFAALATPLPEVRVVVVGQDPYHGPGQACGLAFSVPPGVPPPPSLMNILAELENDLGILAPCQLTTRGSPGQTRNGDLSPWTKRGVLLLNACLTVRAGLAGSHRGIGWERFTGAVLRAVAAQPRRIVWLLWGSDARRTAESALRLPAGSLPPAGHRVVGPRCRGVEDPPDQQERGAADHLVLTAPHPSPLAGRGGGPTFRGCRHFSRCNDFLRFRGVEPVDWGLP